MLRLNPCGQRTIIPNLQSPYKPWYSRNRVPALMNVWRCCGFQDLWVQFSDGSIYHYPEQDMVKAVDMLTILKYGTTFNKTVRRSWPIDLCYEKVTSVPPHVELIYSNPPYLTTPPGLCPIVDEVFGNWIWVADPGPSDHPVWTYSFDGFSEPCTSDMAITDRGGTLNYPLSWSTSYIYTGPAYWVNVVAQGNVDASNSQGMTFRITHTATPVLDLVWNPGDNTTLTRTFKMLPDPTIPFEMHVDLGTSIAIFSKTISIQAWTCRSTT